MALDNECPLPTELSDISNLDCEQAHDQILKVLFTKPDQGFADATAYDTESNWTTRIAAIDVTKIAVSPYLVNNTTTPGGPILFGGNDNTTVRGVSRTVGEEFTELTWELHNITEEITREVRALQKFARNGQLACYLVGDNFSYFAGQTPTSDYYGIKISDMFLQGWQNFGGITAPDSRVLTIKFDPTTTDTKQFFSHSNFNPANLIN